MATCNCTGATCNCLITDGSGITVTGSGTEADPYVISSTGISGLVTVVSTATLELLLTGAGTVSDPVVLYGQARLSMTDLIDMVPGQAPAAGDTVLWDADAGGWVSAPLPAGGFVETGAGISGDGTSSDPLGVAVAGVWGVAPLAAFGTDSTIGDPVFVDSTGALRTWPRPDAVRVNTYVGDYTPAGERTSYTWTRPGTTDGGDRIKALVIRGCGGGGGGGGGAAHAVGYAVAGGGGGGGGYGESVIAAADVPDTMTIEVGNGGAATSGAAGGTGGYSRVTINAQMSLTFYGGSGGGLGVETQLGFTRGGGHTPPPSGGRIWVAGEPGRPGEVVLPYDARGGSGGRSYLAGRIAGSITVLPGLDGSLYGSGGTGARGDRTVAESARAGGAGGPGIVIVEEVY